MEDGCIQTTSTPAKPRLRRLKKVAIGLLSLYLILCVVMFSIQNRLIFPGAATHGTAEAIVAPSPDFELVHLKTADGDPFVAMFGVATDAMGRPASDSRSRPTLLFFYGNAMCLAATADLFSSFRRLGANVMIVEYPGYGMSGGKASERSLYAAGDAAYECLTHRSDIDPHKIVAAGWSLGAAVATDVAFHHPVAGLATLSAFTSMPAVAHSLFPWLPTSLIVRSRFDNEAKLATITCPIFNAHGTHDELVPFAMSRRLIAAAKGPVTSVEVDSGHNDIFTSGGDQLAQRFRRFLDSVEYRAR